ncbi:lytic polysaccharide monooxygenase [Actinomadura sp.]|uniref:lytic polysaccharide monooxygenase n=1 Tax=Actinomadura sp. TaxID=1989 RepID=UPI0037C8E96A
MEALPVRVQTGRYAPSNNYVISNVTAPGRTGRHVVFTIWQASHMDQAYYICSDVNFR